MIWLICFAVSILILAFSIVLARSVSERKYKRDRMFTPFNTIFIGVFLYIFFSMVPIYSGILPHTSSGVMKMISLSLHSTIQVFTADADHDIILNSINCPFPRLSSLYSVLLSGAFVVAPVLTFGFIVSLFKNASSFLRFILFFFREAYVFSELNDESLSLGSDIREHHKKAVIIYTGVFENGDEAVFELAERARGIGAILFKKDILSINFNAHHANAPIVFYVIGKDETENINQSLRIIERYRYRDNTRLFVFSSRIDGELLLTKADRGKLKVRRINTTRSLVNRILYERGQLIFTNARDIESGGKKISAVIVGMGGHGTEMLKALAWFCQMDGYHVEINAFDLDNSAEDRFSAIAPELISGNYNDVSIPGEAEYTIRIHSGIDVSTKTFADEITKLTDSTFVFISLGSDTLNIKTAVEMRMLFERMNIKPVIQSVVRNSAEKNALKDITNHKGQPYCIEFVGDNDTSYSESVIMNSDLELDALQRHLKYFPEESFWLYEYNYNSSVASAIHMKARAVCGIPGATSGGENLTDEERKRIEALEHRRWNAYMRSEGYIFSGSTDKNSRNDLAKMHHDLVEYTKLSLREKEKDFKLGTK